MAHFKKNLLENLFIQVLQLSNQQEEIHCCVFWRTLRHGPLECVNFSPHGDQIGFQIIPRLSILFCRNLICLLVL